MQTFIFPTWPSSFFFFICLDFIRWSPDLHSLVAYIYLSLTRCSPNAKLQPFTPESGGSIGNINQNQVYPFLFFLFFSCMNFICPLKYKKSSRSMKKFSSAAAAHLALLGRGRHAASLTKSGRKPSKLFFTCRRIRPLLPIHTRHHILRRQLTQLIFHLL